MAERQTGAGQLGRDAQWLRSQPGEDDAGVVAGDMSEKACIYPGCDRPAVPPHPLGGPQPSFCDLEEHNALTAHLKRRRLAREASGEETNEEEQ